MRRCPKCNQQFTDEWLTFCTQDGTSLVDVPFSSNEPPPTMVYPPPMPPSVSPSEQPTMDFPESYKPPLVVMAPQQAIQPGWIPPPPPAYGAHPDQTMAVIAMIAGLVSITIGWCCSVGLLTSPFAIVLGIVSLFQIKKDPRKYGGKGMAIAGIITGSVFLAILVLIALIWGLGILLSIPS